MGWAEHFHFHVVDTVQQLLHNEEGVAILSVFNGRNPCNLCSLATQAKTTITMFINLVILIRHKITVGVNVIDKVIVHRQSKRFSTVTSVSSNYNWLPIINYPAHCFLHIVALVAFALYDEVPDEQQAISLTLINVENALTIRTILIHLALNVKAGVCGACQLTRVMTMCCFIQKIFNQFSNCTDPRALNLVLGDISEQRVRLVILIG